MEDQMNRVQTKGTARRIRFASTALGLLSLGMVWATGCGGVAAEPDAGGESHFLHECDSECGGGLDCVAGVCTKGCLVGEATCDNLAPSAICTDESVEPGEVAVCDVSCDGTGDCAELGAGYHCSSGFCRYTDANGSGGSTSSGGSNGSGATGNGASSNGGGGNGFDPGSVFPCPDGEVESDPLDVSLASWHGDVLTLQVEHGGGCAEHEYSLCFGAFLESYPVQSELRLIHDANGDNCEAWISQAVDFDLTPVREAYTGGYNSDAGLIDTTYGMYAFGALTCEERMLAASQRAGDAVEWSNTFCNDVSDCEWVSLDTACAKGCGGITSTEGVPQVSEQIEVIESTICGDYEADDCPPVPIPTCLPPGPMACINNECVQSEGG
jgi:hypothetical protein